LNSLHNRQKRLRIYESIGRIGILPKKWKRSPTPGIMNNFATNVFSNNKLVFIREKLETDSTIFQATPTLNSTQQDIGIYSQLIY
jgi:hypothetical protein